MRRSNSGAPFLAKSSESDVTFQTLLRCMLFGPFETQSISRSYSERPGFEHPKPCLGRNRVDDLLVCKDLAVSDVTEHALSWLALPW
jgi:hypothetical protein